MECPICHVANPEGSLFCSECGQRISSGSTNNPSDTDTLLLKPPVADAVPKRPITKLHSPILDRESHDDPGQNRQSSKFPHRQTSLPNLSDIAKPVTPSPGLRSPLLEPNLNQEETLRLEKPVDNQKIKTSGRLHSPVLEGRSQIVGFEKDEFWEIEETDDPNVLRSPLLAAKLPLSDKPTVQEESKNLAQGKQIPDATFAKQAEATSAFKSTMPVQENKTPTPPPYLATDSYKTASQKEAASSKNLDKAKSTASAKDAQLASLWLKDKQTESLQKPQPMGTSVVVILIAAVVFTKAYFLYSLSRAELSNHPFLIDQIVQALVTICLIIFVSHRANE